MPGVFEDVQTESPDCLRPHYYLFEKSLERKVEMSPSKRYFQCCPVDKRTFQVHKVPGEFSVKIES